MDRQFLTCTSWGMWSVCSRSVPPPKNDVLQLESRTFSPQTCFSPKEVSVFWKFILQLSDGNYEQKELNPFLISSIGCLLLALHYSAEHK